MVRFEFTLHAHYLYLVEQITELETALEQELNRDEIGQRPQTIPGIGPITASVLSSQLGDGNQCGCSRDFAASTGLVPRQYSTGGKNTLLGIRKRGNKNLRRLLVQCARSFIQRIVYLSRPVLHHLVANLVHRQHSLLFFRFHRY